MQPRTDLIQRMLAQRLLWKNKTFLHSAACCVSYILCWLKKNPLTWTKSASPLGLKYHSTVAAPSTSLLLLQEMQPSLNPLPATASVSESTSAQAPWHWYTVGKIQTGNDYCRLTWWRNTLWRWQVMSVNSPNRLQRRERSRRCDSAMSPDVGVACF